MIPNADHDDGRDAGLQARDPTSAPGAYAQLHRAFARQVVLARDYAHAGNFASARDARLAADAICDELSAE